MTLSKKVHRYTNSKMGVKDSLSLHLHLPLLVTLLAIAFLTVHIQRPE